MCLGQVHKFLIYYSSVKHINQISEWCIGHLKNIEIKSYALKGFSIVRESIHLIWRALTPPLKNLCQIESNILIKREDGTSEILVQTSLSRLEYRPIGASTTAEDDLGRDLFVDRNEVEAPF
jgi:hypothetical protein